MEEVSEEGRQGRATLLLLNIFGIMLAFMFGYKQLYCLFCRHLFGY